MKNIVVKFKAGYVGMAHNLGGEIASYKFEQEELGFAVGKQTPDTGIPNTFWALDSIMKDVAKFVTENPQEKVTIAVPGTVYALVSSFEMLTKLMWTRKMVYTTVTDQKSRRTILLHRKTQDQYTLSDAEWVAYKNLFANVKRLMGYVLFVDSTFVSSNAENAKTKEQQEWVNLNLAVNGIIGINAGSGAQSPYAATGTGTNGVANTAGDTNTVDDNDLPF